MLRHVLVCLDSGSVGGDAQAFAMDYADHYPGAMVSAIYVHTLPDPAPALETGVLERFREQPRARDVTVRGIMRGRDCTAEISAVAHTADLIVMAPQPTGPLATVVPDLVRVIPRPFLFSADRRAIQGPVLVALDGSWASDRALRCAAEIAASWRPDPLEVALLGVVSGPDDPVGHLEPAARYLKVYGISARVMCATGVAAEEIGRTAADIGAGLICMGAFGHTALREALLGSTTSSVFRQHAIPLLCAH